VRELEAELADASYPVALHIEVRSGVAARRVHDAEMDVVDMSLEACDRALSAADGVSTADIDLVIYCGISRKYVEPATATAIHGRLGLRNAMAFDVSDACLGFIDGWMIADTMIATGRATTALVVAAETLSHYGDLAMKALRAGAAPDLHFAALTLGDGAAAAILAPRKEVGEGFLVGLRETHGEHHGLCVITDTESPMLSGSNRLLREGLRNFRRSAEKVLEASRWKASDLDLVVPHQASAHTIEHGRRELGIGHDKVAVTLDRYGNMASVAVPYALASAVDAGRVGPGSKVLLAGFGFGLGVGMMSVRL
jgi:3-oxoacyl-[acyl-carrier-protein] synthase-3